MQALADAPAFRPLAPYGSVGSPDGIGAYSTRPQAGAASDGSLGFSPLLTAVKKFSRPRSLRGLGDDSQVAVATGIASGAALVVTAVVLAGCAVSGYYAGKAMAPSRAKQSKYAWWGVAATVLGGPIGLGIEAAVALSHKGD